MDWGGSVLTQIVSVGNNRVTLNEILLFSLAPNEEDGKCNLNIRWHHLSVLDQTSLYKQFANWQQNLFQIQFDWNWEQQEKYETLAKRNVIPPNVKSIIWTREME